MANAASGVAKITAQIQWKSNVEELKRLIGEGTRAIRAMKQRRKAAKKVRRRPKRSSREDGQ